MIGVLTEEITNDPGTALPAPEDRSPSPKPMNPINTAELTPTKESRMEMSRFSTHGMGKLENEQLMQEL